MLVEPASYRVWRPDARWAVAASSRPHPIGSSGSRKGRRPRVLWSLSCGRDQAGFAAGVMMEPGWQDALGSRGRARWGTGQMGDVGRPSPPGPKPPDPHVYSHLYIKSRGLDA